MRSELLTVSEAARWAKVSESYLNKARLTGDGPRFIRLGRAIRYREADLEAWAQGSAETSGTGHVAAPRFADDAVRTVVIAERGKDFAASYLDPAEWDRETRTIQPHSSIAKSKLAELAAALPSLGVTVGEARTGGR